MRACALIRVNEQGQKKLLAISDGLLVSWNQIRWNPLGAPPSLTFFFDSLLGFLSRFALTEENEILVTLSCKRNVNT